MAVTLINVFNVPAEKEAEFLENWKKTTEVFRKRTGFLETHLHKNTGVGNTTFQFINIAKWESAEAWKTNHDEYKPTEYSIPGVVGHPSIYEEIINVHNESIDEKDRATSWVW